MNQIQADEAGYERGWEQAEDYWRAKEQERIIKVLEDDYWHYLITTPSAYENNKLVKKGVTIHAENCLGCQFIVAIKGENK